MDDIILVTIDCWRADAPDVMPQLSQMTEQWQSNSMICAAAATSMVFPTIFASQFYPKFHQTGRSIPEYTHSLPSVLSDHGYSTGGFVASNPFLRKWSKHFDTWWNDGMSVHEADANSRTTKTSLSNKFMRLLTTRPHVPAEDLLMKADNWWDRTDSPRFLWVHLMEPHEPYLPGFHLAREIGLFRSYAAIVGHSQLDRNPPAWMRKHLKRLHYQCNRKLDRVLTPWLKSHDDAVIVLTGDHGEEFDHGIIGHARLYDETVRVPVLSNNLFRSVNNADPLRQIDLAPSFLNYLDITAPSAWKGTTATGLTQPQKMITGSPRFERNWIGLRSKSWKLILTYDWDEGFQEFESYHLKSDPTETDPKPKSAVPDALLEQLNSFIDTPLISQELSQNERKRSGVDSAVEKRLSELGYTE